MKPPTMSTFTRGTKDVHGKEKQCAREGCKRNVRGKEKLCDHHVRLLEPRRRVYSRDVVSFAQLVCSGCMDGSAVFPSIGVESIGDLLLALNEAPTFGDIIQYTQAYVLCENTGGAGGTGDAGGATPPATGDVVEQLYSVISVQLRSQSLKDNIWQQVVNMDVEALSQVFAATQTDGSVVPTLRPLYREYILIWRIAAEKVLQTKRVTTQQMALLPKS